MVDEEFAFFRRAAQMRLCLLGASLDTGNLGVAALGVSTIAGVAERVERPQVQLFGHSSEPQWRDVDLPGGSLRVSERGLWLSRNVHRAESIYRLYGSHLLGFTGNPVVRLMRSADAVWDVSGGDSFSDIYGERRFLKLVLPKLVAIKHARQLILLPQTYGPFRGTMNRRLAKRIILGAHRSWARDADSFERLVELAGSDFDRKRHRRGVDVAFLLPAVRPAGASETIVSEWQVSGRPVVGINVSGLLGRDQSSERFGLALSHDEVLVALIRRFIDRTDVGVLLIPHVRSQDGESDLAACRNIRQRFAETSRVAVLDDASFDAPSATKWAIGQLDWMTGARMHSTIAALSTGTPVTGIAYSDKMHGVFASCGVAGEVLDARKVGTVDAVDRLWDGYERRDHIADTLARTMPTTLNSARTMFDELVSTSLPSIW